MITIKQIYYENFIMKLKFILFQRFQNFKNYIDTELRDIVIAFFEEIEHVINETIFLIFYIKNNFKYNDFNAVAQIMLIVKIINDEQNANLCAKSTIIIANNFSNNRQSNDECVVENESIILIEILRRTFTTTMQRSNTTTIKTNKAKNR